MQRALVLLFPIMVVAAGAIPTSSSSVVDPATLAVSWKSSVTAELGQNYDEALKENETFQQGGGDKYVGTLRSAWLTYLKADYQHSAELYAAASRLQPSAITPLLGLMSAAQGLNDAAKIRIAAESVLRAEPTNYRAQMVISGLYFSAKDYRKSLSCYRRVLTYYPGDLDALSGASWSAYYVGEKRDAADGFQKILSMNPDYPSASNGGDLSAAPANHP